MFWYFKETRQELWRITRILWLCRPHVHQYIHKAEIGEEEHGTDYSRRFCKVCDEEQWMVDKGHGKISWHIPEYATNGSYLDEPTPWFTYGTPYKIMKWRMRKHETLGR